MMKIGFAVLALFYFTVGNAWAQKDSLTVEQAIAYALHNNYDILLAKEDSAIAAINYEYRNAAFLPNVNGNATYLRNTNAQRQVLADGSKRERNGIKTTNLNASINLNWTLFDGFRMFLLRDQLDQSVRLGSLTIKNAVINTVANVITTYFDIVRQKQQLKNVEEQLLLAQDRLRLAQYRFDIGVGIKPDVLQAQIDVNTGRASQLSQQTLIIQRKQTLNQVMNVAPDADYNVSDTITARTDLILGNLLTDLAQGNPQLQIARTSIEVAALNVRLARASRYPTFSLISAYNFNRSSNSTVINPFQPLFNLNRGLNYGVTLTVPIVNNFTARQQIRQAQLAVEYQNLRLQNQESLVRTGIITNFQAYQNQMQVIAILDSSITLARENLFIERERYRLGRTTFIELRTAEQNVANIITNRINASFNMKQAETELLRLRGDLVR